MDSSTQDKRARLPKWARDEMAVLEMRLREARAEIAAYAAGPDGSDTIAQPYDDHPHMLGMSPLVRFMLGPEASRHALDVKIDGDQIVLRSLSGRLAVTPSSSNSIYVGIAR
jgi:hypothetical protein